MTSRGKYILGAIAGDIMGSVYEGSDLKRYDIDLFTEKADFTDDTVLTIATMDCLLKRIIQQCIGIMPGSFLDEDMVVVLLIGYLRPNLCLTIVVEMVLRCALVL